MNVIASGAGDYWWWWQQPYQPTWPPYQYQYTYTTGTNADPRVPALEKRIAELEAKLAKPKALPAKRRRRR